MDNRTISDFVTRLRSKLGELQVVRRKHVAGSDPTIREFIFLLDIPKDRLVEVENAAWELAIDLYRDEPIPFLISAVSPENSSRYFGGGATNWRRF